MISIKVEKLDNDIQTITNALKNKYSKVRLTTTGIEPGEVIIDNPNDLAVTLTIDGIKNYLLKVYTQYEGEFRVETNSGTKAFDNTDKVLDYIDKFISRYFKKV